MCDRLMRRKLCRYCALLELPAQIYQCPPLTPTLKKFLYSLLLLFFPMPLSHLTSSNFSSLYPLTYTHTHIQCLYHNFPQLHFTQFVYLTLPNVLLFSSLPHTSSSPIFPFFIFSPLIP